MGFVVASKFRQEACKKFVGHEEVRGLPAINVFVIGFQMFVISMEGRAVVERDFRVIPQTFIQGVRDLDGMPELSNEGIDEGLVIFCEARPIFAKILRGTR